MILRLEQIMDEGLRPGLGATQSNAGVCINEVNKLLYKNVSRTLDHSVVVVRNLRAVRATDRQIHLRPTLVGFCDNGTIRNVSFAMLVVPKDGDRKIRWALVWGLHRFEQVIDRPVD